MATRCTEIAYMQEEISRKLTAQLNEGITTEVQVVYLLIGIRKLIEHDNKWEQYPTLNFSCDWVLHSKLDRSAAKAILREFDKAHPLWKSEEKLPRELEDKIKDICGMESFKEELTEFLESYDLPPIAQNVDGWSRFFYLYGQVIHDIPLMVKPSSPEAAENISKLVVHCETAPETIKSGDREDLVYRIVWEIFDKTGESGSRVFYNTFNIAAGFKSD